METLVVVAQHRDRYCSQVKAQGLVRFGSSPPLRDYRGLNSCGLQSSAGIFPSPFKSKSKASPVSKQACSSSPKTPPPSYSSVSDRKLTRSAPIAINSKVSNRRKFFAEEFSGESLSFSELWAGPAYSNSPPPSSLPIPKFSVRPKRTVSLELPSLVHDVELRPIAKSAPTSPTREHGFYTRSPFRGADSATETLRRILNLDVDYEWREREGRDCDAPVNKRVRFRLCIERRNLVGFVFFS